MALPAEDQRLVADMRERQYNIKKRQRAANMIFAESRQYRRIMITITALTVACVAVGVHVGAEGAKHGWLTQWRPDIVLAVTGAIVGSVLGFGLMRTSLGQRLLAGKERRLHQKYSGDLHAGRRWMQFFYRNEDISPYVPQLLYVLDSERRFDSVPAALDFVKQHHYENSMAQAHAMRQFNEVVARTNLVVLSSTGTGGQPSSRVMRFVTTDKPGVWYVTSAPDTPKVHEFDEGKVSLLTLPGPDGAAVSSNQVSIRRAEVSFPDIADLYRAQAPGYLDGMTEEDQRLELVYELTLRSAKVDSWVSHDLVILLPDAAYPMRRRPLRCSRAVSM